MLVETRRPTLSRGMRELIGVYSQRFNRRHGHVGHGSQGRFKSVLVDRVCDLLELSRYIVINPVRAGLCARAQDGRWSSYRAVMGKAPLPDRLPLNQTPDLFATSCGVARRAYDRFVAAGVNAVDPSRTQSRESMLQQHVHVRASTPKIVRPLVIYSGSEPGA